MKLSVRSIAQSVEAQLIGDGTIEVSGIASIAEATPVDLAFVQDKKGLGSALTSQAAALIVGEFAKDQTSTEGIATETTGAKPLLISRNPKLAFARAAHLLYPRPDSQPGIHASAVVHSSVRLAKDVALSERVIIGANVEIGEHAWLGPGAVSGARVAIGHDCELYPNVTIYPCVRLCNRVIVHAGSVLGSDGFGYVCDHATGRYEKFPQIGSLEIEDDVEIGANSTIDRGALEVTRIGRGCKLDNLVHVGHNCQIGEDVVIAAQTGLSGSVVVGKSAVLAGQVGIAEHVRIEEGVILGAQSGVPSNKVVRGRGVAFWGTPARPLRGYLKQLAVLARLARKE